MSMSKTSKFVFVLSLVFTGLTLGTPARAAHIKVFLLGGQSNMEGNNAMVGQLPAYLQAPQENVLYYYGTTFTNLQSGGGNNFGPEISFGWEIENARPYETYCLIKHAQGGTNIQNDWDPVTGNTYRKFRTVVSYGLDALTKAGHTYEIVGMLWTQGERDALNGRTTAQYEADLNEFIADIRSRYGADLPFFISRLSVQQTARDISQIRPAQENVAANDPNAYLIDTDSFELRSDDLHFEETGFVDVGEAFAASYLSATADATAPAIDSLSPANTAPAVEPTANLSITFDEAITFGSGTISLRQSGGALVESFDVGAPSAGLSISGATLTIDPTSLLAASTGHYVEIDATAITDMEGNSFGGISGSGTWSFTSSAADTNPPLISSLSPNHLDTGIRYNQNLTITFNENVSFGSGHITLRQSGGALVESYDVAGPSANLTLNGGTLTINPTNDLAISTTYYIDVDATAINDHAGNSFAGFSGDGTWSFTTAAPLIDGSLITATASDSGFGADGTATAHPYFTVDGSGLSGGEHGTTGSWQTNFKDPTYQWIQWDLGASYMLDTIHVWNLSGNGSIRSVDIFFSNLPNPGGAGAANWTRLGAGSVELPQAVSPNTGFDLATATSTNLPASEVRFVRFEINTNYQGDAFRTGLSEIQFTAKPNGPDLTAPTLASSDIVDDAAGGSVATNTLVNYTLTFNEDMNGATVDSSDFSNAGTALISIGAITETSARVFTVEVTPTSAGSLQLQVSAGATLTDVAGNALDTSSAITDATTLNVIFNNPPDVNAGLDQTVYLSGEAPWSPADLATAAWYDATDAATITESLGSVSQWDDKSGNQAHLTQGNGVAQPQTGAVLNTQPALAFDAGDWISYVGRNIDYGTGAPAMQVIYVAKPLSVSTTHQYAFGYSSGGPVGGQAFANSVGNNDGAAEITGRHYDGYVESDSAYTINNDILLVSYSLAAGAGHGSAQFHINGTATGVSTNNPSNTLAFDAETPDLTLGAVASSGDASSQIVIGEFIMLPAVLSEADRQKVEGYLGP
jgi:hypothetical protein